MFTATDQPVLLYATFVEDVLPLILGVGGAAALAALFKFILAMRDSAEGREAKAIRNLERWRDYSDRRAELCLERLDNQRQWTSYWQGYAGQLVHTLYLNGVAVPPPTARPPEPLPPSPVDDEDE